MQCFYSSSGLENHKQNCIVVNDVQAIELSKEGQKVYLKNYKKQLPVPFVIYADFESILEKNELL